MRVLLREFVTHFPTGRPVVALLPIDTRASLLSTLVLEIQTRPLAIKYAMNSNLAKLSPEDKNLIDKVFEI